MGIFLSIRKEDCQEITSSQLDNGLLEIVGPKSCSDAELSKYLSSISSELSAIEKKQKKKTEVFRKKVKQLIDKYEEEFKLNVFVKLRLQEKTQKLNDCNLNLYGIEFEANVALMAALQYVPEDIAEKIIRYTVYDLACMYEQRCSEIKGFTASTIRFTESDVINESKVEVPEKAKYMITMPYSEIEKIQEDYKDAVKQFCDYLKKNHIASIK